MDKVGYLIVNGTIVIDSSTSITSLPDSAIVEEFTTRDAMYQEAFNRGLISEMPDAIPASELKQIGANYNGYQIPFTGEDAVGMLQVKEWFIDHSFTNIHFSNGTIMPMTVEEFPAFSAWFKEHRGAFFL